jgi:tetratricopeptide (TPR) repeat protein
MSLGNLGHAFLDQGDVIKAQSYYERSLGISREVGDRRVECVTMVNLGLLFHRMGDNETARQYSQQALRVAKDIDARERQGDSLTNLGHALAGLGQWTEAAVAYQDALDIWRELGRYNLAMEPLAGLVRISLAQDDLALARTQVEEILRHLEIGALDGTEEPFRVYLTCYQALKANADPRAQDILSTAYNLLQARAAKISDEQVRRSFLENVLTHRELIAAWLTL